MRSLRSPSSLEEDSVVDQEAESGGGLPPAVRRRRRRLELLDLVGVVLPPLAREHALAVALPDPEALRDDRVRILADEAAELLERRELLGLLDEGIAAPLGGEALPPRPDRLVLAERLLQGHRHSGRWRRRESSRTSCFRFGRGAGACSSFDCRSSSVTFASRGNGFPNWPWKYCPSNGGRGRCPPASRLSAA